MGYYPRATRGTKPFLRGDSTLLLAEKAGMTSTPVLRASASSAGLLPARLIRAFPAVFPTLGLGTRKSDTIRS